MKHALNWHARAQRYSKPGSISDSVRVLRADGFGSECSMASRTEQRATEAITRLKAEIPAADVHFLPFDLTQFASATSAAERFMKQEQRLDILVNNAGIVSQTVSINLEETIDSVENVTGYGVIRVRPRWNRSTGL